MDTNSLRITGKVYDILQVETTPSGFQKRSLILETDSKYPQLINIEFLKNNIDLLDHYKKGDEVNVYYNINGRKWESESGIVKYFNSIVGWKIESASNKVKPANVYEAFDEVASDDLPF